MNLYIIKGWNSVGGCIGSYYVISEGVNAAKRKVREYDKIVKKVEIVEVRFNILIVD